MRESVLFAGFRLLMLRRLSGKSHSSCNSRDQTMERKFTLPYSFISMFGFVRFAGAEAFQWLGGLAQRNHKAAPTTILSR
jgi:hypothetical protein